MKWWIFDDRSEEQKKADEIIKMDYHRYRCGFDERDQEQRDKDKKTVKKYYGYYY